MSEAAHRPVLLAEAVDALSVRPDGVYVDGTFGRGGHSRAILARLGPGGRLLALDRDPTAIAEAQTINDPRFEIVHSRFADIADVLAERGMESVDGILLDIGVSSPQIDMAERGFSFRFDGPLDMRMDTSRGETASEWLMRADEGEIGEVIRNYGEERFAKQVARAIVAARAGGVIATTRQLAEIVAKAVRTREPNQDPATRTFQALRIFINQELEELSLVLPQCVRMLRPGGRLAVISFHSLEDRIVKGFMREMSTADVLPRGVPVRASDLREPPLRLVGKAIRAGEGELAENPRARSAVLRVAERTAGAMPGVKRVPA